MTSRVREDGTEEEETTGAVDGMGQTETPGLASGMRHLARAFDALRAGTRTSLHLHPNEHAAVTAHLKESPPEHGGTRDLIHRLLSGDVVQPPANMDEIQPPTQTA